MFVATMAPATATTAEAIAGTGGGRVGASSDEEDDRCGGAGKECRRCAMAVIAEPAVDMRPETERLEWLIGGKVSSVELPPPW